MNLEDLEKLHKERKSTKNLANGPAVHGKKSPYGKVKFGNSVPLKVLARKDDLEFGMHSYHKKGVGTVKTAI
eukprot:CAMPEP_0185616050 /NCGR_PEP_ID=MMETSP0436-20130131/38132_1 /TAXON_ID=626734 ORGANISM="Favella taraikaensis, Strain Fe Narragansett Bay" /NCGR_SAMPLE_ID=MMETSP0436 /ASSEMBLY_ACC=CAM_ASM_000390 /LENGTH=71 /DNA_ID=CAMNT_0028252377 /DNA_START=172 /DNA_END=387 /DNA_ORIENTATION=+